MITSSGMEVGYSSIPDLLVSAAGELSGLTVLHVDKDFEIIAAVTQQPVERLEAPG